MQFNPSFPLIRTFSLALGLSITLSACQSKPVFQAPTGEAIQVEVMRTEADKTKGLSGRASKDFGESQAMLFWYDDVGPRRFWMPDTHFDLDIFFLDKDWVILDVDRNVPHYTGSASTAYGGAIPTTRTVFAQHVLEMKASSKHSKAIQIGQKLQWKRLPK